MLRSALDWLGFGKEGHSHAGHGHGNSHTESGHGHAHGVMDPTIVTTARGIWAIKWSFALLAITAVLQSIVVAFSGSVALLADTIHNVGDAATAIPLWVAFVFARRKPSLRFTYGLGRVEDLAGAAIVAIILFSAIVAGYQAIDRLINPRDIDFLAWVALAGIIGFLGNEIVAVFRIRVGREINSAALIADGYHARVDGLTSIAVVVGAIGVWLGFPLADPIVGIIITIMIFGIVWQSARSVFTRMLDGVEPEIVDELKHAAEHVPEIRGLENVRARWIGHRLYAEADMIMNEDTTVSRVESAARALRATAIAHMPPLESLRIGVVAPAAVPLGSTNQADSVASRHKDSHRHGHDHDSSTGPLRHAADVPRTETHQFIPGHDHVRDHRVGSGPAPVCSLDAERHDLVAR